MSQLFRVEQSKRTSDDYLTPAWVFDVLGLEFDLDVAAPPCVEAIARIGRVR